MEDSNYVFRCTILFARRNVDKMENMSCTGSVIKSVRLVLKRTMIKKCALNVMVVQTVSKLQQASSHMFVNVDRPGWYGPEKDCFCCC